VVTQMAKKIGIITIHGMGEQKPNFDDGLKKALRRQFRNGVNADIAFKGIYYQGFIQPYQTRVWNDMGSRATVG